MYCACWEFSECLMQVWSCHGCGQEFDWDGRRVSPLPSPSVLRWSCVVLRGWLILLLHHVHARACIGIPFGGEISEAPEPPVSLPLCCFRTLPHAVYIIPPQLPGLPNIRDPALEDLRAALVEVRHSLEQLKGAKEKEVGSLADFCRIRIATGESLPTDAMFTGAHEAFATVTEATRPGTWGGAAAHANRTLLTAAAIVFGRITSSESPMLRDVDAVFAFWFAMRLSGCV